MPSPITSRVKRHPSFGPLKSDKDPKANAETFTEGKTETTKENVDSEKVESKKPYVGAENDACSAEYIAKNGRAKCDEYNALPKDVKDKANKTITEKCPEGSTKDADGNCVKETKTTTPGSRGDVYTETESRVLQPWEIRRLNRSGRIADNRISSSSRRLSNLGATQDAEGNWSLPEGASAKQTRKFNKFKSKFERNSMQKANVDRSVKSGRGAGELIHSGQRKTTQSEINKDPGSVKAQEKLNADRAAFEAEQAKQDAITNSIGSSTKPKAESIDPNQANPFTDMLKKFEEDKQKGNYTFGKFNVDSPKPSGLFAKKGAMKKGYFKGN